ncbi:MAG TPA: flagellar filament capping protein FliD [Terriglobales bacterium]|nr:flagellar filament capping protein FliD [Terriglobales bacterium]
MGTFGIDLSSLTGSQGIDVNSLISQLSYVARAPERVWQVQQQGLQVQMNALTSLNTGVSAILDKLNSLKDFSGAMGSVVTSSSNSDLVTASASAGASIGSHVVVVNSLATTASYYSAAVATGDTTISNGSFSIQVGSAAPVTVTIDGTNNTLNKLAATINGLGLGVTAGVTTDVSGARLTIVAKSSGAASDITISGDTSGLGLTKAAAGTNAKLTVDGVPIESATNSVSGVVPDVTFNLIGASPGTQVTIGVAPDTDAIVQAVNDFVDAYNTVAQQFTQGFAVDPTSKQAGALVGDSSADMMQQQLLDMMTYSVTGAGSFATLRSLGISLANDGTLSVNANTLKNAVAGNYTDVKSFFQSDAGFATFFSKELTQETDPTQGVLFADLKGLQSTQESLQDQIDNFEQFLVAQQQQWQKQYEQANIVLQQLPQLEKQIEIQLGTYSTSSK